MEKPGKVPLMSITDSSGHISHTQTFLTQQPVRLFHPKFLDISIDGRPVNPFEDLFEAEIIGRTTPGEFGDGRRNDKVLRQNFSGPYRQFRLFFRYAFSGKFEKPQMMEQKFTDPQFRPETRHILFFRNRENPLQQVEAQRIQRLALKNSLPALLPQDPMEKIDGIVPTSAQIAFEMKTGNRQNKKATPRLE